MLTTELRELPYLVHTNRELGLMLRGKKPLAVFADIRGAYPECVTRYLRMFDRHVSIGRLVKREDIRPLPGRDKRTSEFELHRILYSLPAETWRIDAMIELWAEHIVWTEAEERLEGQLLGYEDWQCDVWIARWSSSKTLD